MDQACVGLQPSSATYELCDLGRIVNLKKLFIYYKQPRRKCRNIIQYLMFDLSCLRSFQPGGGDVRSS